MSGNWYFIRLDMFKLLLKQLHGVIKIVLKHRLVWSRNQGVENAYERERKQDRVV